MPRKAIGTAILDLMDRSPDVCGSLADTKIVPGRAVDRRMVCLRPLAYSCLLPDAKASPPTIMPSQLGTSARQAEWLVWLRNTTCGVAVQSLSSHLGEELNARAWSFYPSARPLSLPRTWLCQLGIFITLHISPCFFDAMLSLRGADHSFGKA